MDLFEIASVTAGDISGTRSRSWRQDLMLDRLYEDCLRDDYLVRLDQ